MNLYEIATRTGPTVYRHLAIQAHDEDDARELAERLFCSYDETIMNIHDISYKCPSGTTFREFMAENDEYDALLCTGGSTPSTITREDLVVAA